MFIEFMIHHSEGNPESIPAGSRAKRSDCRLPFMKTHLVLTLRYQFGTVTYTTAIRKMSNPNITADRSRKYNISYMMMYGTCNTKAT